MRPEYPIIVDWVKEGSTVIDLGCGRGELLKMLLEKYRKNIAVYGVEKNCMYVFECEQKGLNVEEGRIDQYLHFWSNEFDYAICNVTIQMVENPDVLLSEMFRISRYQIISFPNFAKWQNRLELLFKGRMPQHMLCGYKWFDTGHIHQLSIKDFEEYIKDKAKVIKKHFLPQRLFPNLTAHTAIYLLEAK